jgi:hemerythrin-like domain-containing protein
MNPSMNLVQLNTTSASEPESLRALLLTCHTRIRRFTRLAFTLGAQRTTPAAEVEEVAQRCLRYFTEALPLHVRDEEDSLAPRLTGRSLALDAILARMRAEHFEHEVLLRALVDSLGAVIERPNRAVLHRNLARAAGTLETHFEGHLRREETELFPLLDQMLPPATQEQIIQELRARRA